MSMTPTPDPGACHRSPEPADLLQNITGGAVAKLPKKERNRKEAL
jgi:hypothetical protein